MEFFDKLWFGIPLHEWLIAACIAVMVWLVLRLTVHVVGDRLGAWAATTSTKWDDIAVYPIQRTKFLFLIVAALYVAALATDLPEPLTRFLKSAFGVALVVQSGVWLNAAISHWLTIYREEKLGVDSASVTTMMAGGFLLRVVLWSLVLLLVLANFGVEIAPLIAGLGVGGIAVALAVQSILSDLFASLSIVLDKPFVIGDFVTVGDLKGHVEQIGLKTTRIRSLTGEQLIFANSDLLSSRIRNYGRMYERRTFFNIGVTYQTGRAQLAKIPELLRGIVEAQAQTRFDRSHLKEYGDYAIIYETVYYVLNPDYTVYMDVQQAINLAIHDAFTAEGIEFAYPTQTLFVNKGAD
jgi:small-conductance mechanosensitive channel